jgi:hypothetical protein
MSLERPVPPVGEEIHLPGPSAQPLVLTIGITMALVGITVSVIFLIVGLVLTVATLALWIRDARAEYQHLPLEHHPTVHDTVPRPEDRPHPAD